MTQIQARPSFLPGLRLHRITLLGLTGLCLSLAGCRSLALSAVADAMAGTGGAFARDEDPELVEAAVPFGLKTMEAILDEKPEHRGLLLALASGFVQYGVAFVNQRADEVEERSYEQAETLRARSRRLFRRALRYALRNLEVEHEGFEAALRQDPRAAVARVERGDVPALYWCAAAYGLYISHSKNDPDAIADLPLVRALADRALALDPDWNQGALHELMISLEASLPEGSRERARAHFERAVALSQGSKVGPYVTLAEAVSVKEQNAREFHQLLDQALAIDVEAFPPQRLANVIMQRRARRLKAASGELFLDDVGESGTDTDAEP